MSAVWLKTGTKMSKSGEYIEIKSFVVVNPNFPVITKKVLLKPLQWQRKK